MAEENPFDRASRALAREARHDLLCWLLGTPAADIGWRGWIDKKFTLPGFPEREGDLVAHVTREDRGGEPWAMGVEFQAIPDPDMLGRLLVYLGFVLLQARPTPHTGDRFAVLPVVVNLTGIGRTGRRMAWKEGMAVDVQPREWNVGEEDAADILAQIERGEAPRVLLAWIPLMKGGAEDATIRWWLRLAEAEKDARRKTELRLVLVFADLADCLDMWKKALEGFAMMRSKVVDEWKDEGKAEGKAEALVEAAREILEAKFAPLPPDLLSKLGETRPLDELKKWTVIAGKAASLADFRRDSGA